MLKLHRETWRRYVLKDWLLLVSATGLAFTSIPRRKLPSYSMQEIQVLFILLSLFVVVKGLENSGLLLWIAGAIEKGSFIPTKLIIITFILSMFVTNDVALVVIVPLTLMLNTNRKDVLIILETLSANAGSSLTPFGNPQNLFMYWYYNIKPLVFINSIAPLSLVFLTLLILVSLSVRVRIDLRPPMKTARVRKSAYLHGILLVLVLLTVLRVLPVSAGVLVVLYALVFERRSLHVDFALLFSFLCFFGLADNIRYFLTSGLVHPKHIFILSALSSQIVSNVPATLLFAKLTNHWEALLWGSNVGGFGSPVGSLANLIAYRIYIANKNTTRTGYFTIKFLAFGYLAFFVGVGLYFSLHGVG